MRKMESNRKVDVDRTGEKIRKMKRDRKLNLIGYVEEDVEKT